MIENDVIESKLRFLQEYLVDLAEYETIALEAYLTQKKDQRFVERTLQLACECCLDIAAHLVSRKGFREPRDNKDLFLILHENKTISEPVCGAMVKMAKFRNIVVHDYARIDPEIVIGILRKNLDDFKSFARDMITFCQV
ncbi:MAG: DUF86 domain-containing protein [Desulfobacterales bacterium]|nr:DUF86 domain-containing protein [Desulfobacterales bacterium]